MKNHLTLLTFPLLMSVALSAAAQPAATEWKDWGGEATRMHYSPLNQITATNVADLKPVWVWDSGKHDFCSAGGATPFARPCTNDALA